ncbi:MAG: NADH-quinone oxidoreductase subunit K [Actinomycetota bacterium]
MSIVLLGTIGGLTTVGLYLITARSLSRIILGFSLLGHASVLALLTAGGPPGEAPIAGKTPVEELTNPVPQALALTAIVISFGLTLFLLALAGRQQNLTGDDLVEDDLEDRRISEQAALEAAREAESAADTETETYRATGPDHHSDDEEPGQDGTDAAGADADESDSAGEVVS